MTSKRGRKPIGEGPATERIQLRVTPAQRLELRRVASANRTGVAGILREAVNELVNDSGGRRLFVRPKF
jgi:hypothetical protein